MPAPRHATAATVPNDLEAFWLPFTPNRAFKAAPRLIARAKDMHYYTPDGRALLDGTAGLWCTNAGHNRDPIVAAIKREAVDHDARTWPTPFYLGRRGDPVETRHAHIQDDQVGRELLDSVDGLLAV